MALTEKASIRSSGVVYPSPLLSSLPDELPMDRRDSIKSTITKASITSRRGLTKVLSFITGIQLLRILTFHPHECR